MTKRLNGQLETTPGGIGDIAGLQDALDSKANANYIINPDFQVWQRGESIAYSGSGVDYFCDRYFGRRGSSHTGMTISKQFDSEYGNIARVQRDSGDAQSGDLNLAQIINSDLAELLAGKQVTVSVKVRLGADFNSQNGAVFLVAYSGTAKDEGGNPYGFATGNQTLISNLTTPTTKGVWHTLSQTITIPSNAKSLMVKCVAINMQGTAGANDYFEIANVKVELGSVATAFEPRRYEEELRDCKYYFERQDASLESFSHFANGFWDSATNFRGAFLYAKKRIIPAMSLSDVSHFTVDHTGAVETPTSIISQEASPFSARLSVNFAVGGTAGQGGVIIANNNTSAYIDIDAEI